MTYNELPINKYLKLKEVATEGRGLVETQVAFISIVYDIAEEEVWDMPLDDYQRKVAGIQFLLIPPTIEGKVGKTITIGDTEYEVAVDGDKMIAGQYIDYQTYRQKNDDKYLVNMLACFLIPKGKKYCEGYFIDEVIKEIGEKMDIITALNLLDVVKKKSLKSMKHTLYCLLVMTRKIQDKEKRKKARTEIRTLISSL